MSTGTGSTIIARVDGPCGPSAALRGRCRCRGSRTGIVPLRGASSAQHHRDRVGLRAVGAGSAPDLERVRSVPLRAAISAGSAMSRRKSKCVGLAEEVGLVGGDAVDQVHVSPRRQPAVEQLVGIFVEVVEAERAHALAQRGLRPCASCAGAAGCRPRSGCTGRSAEIRALSPASRVRPPRRRQSRPLQGDGRSAGRAASARSKTMTNASSRRPMPEMASTSQRPPTSGGGLERRRRARSPRRPGRPQADAERERPTPRRVAGR